MKKLSAFVVLGVFLFVLCGSALALDPVDKQMSDLTDFITITRDDNGDGPELVTAKYRYFPKIEGDTSNKPLPAWNDKRKKDKKPSTKSPQNAVSTEQKTKKINPMDG
jgi:hypothetical protein